MATLISETTPLLTDSTPIVETHYDAYLATLTIASSNDETSLPASVHFPRTRRIINIFILIASTIIIILIIPIRILAVEISYQSDILYFTRQLLYLMMLTFLFAAINLIWNFPVILNIFLEIYLIYMIAWHSVVRFIVIEGRPNRWWCYKRGTNILKDNKAECDAKLLALEILLSFVYGLASAVALGHLVLSALRNKALKKSKFWRRSPWEIAARQIAVEVSIKRRRQDRGEVSGAILSQNTQTES